MSPRMQYLHDSRLKNNPPSALEFGDMAIKYAKTDNDVGIVINTEYQYLSEM